MSDSFFCEFYENGKTFYVKLIEYFYDKINCCTNVFFYVFLLLNVLHNKMKEKNGDEKLIKKVLAIYFFFSKACAKSKEKSDREEN